MRNRKSQKLREGFDDFLARCVERSEQKSEVELDFVLEMMKNSDIKLEKLGDKERKISR